MPTATLVLLLVAGVTLVVTLGLALALVSRGLVRTSETVNALGDRLGRTEQRLQELHRQLAEVDEDMGEVTSQLAERRRDEVSVHRG